jgi:hypothetical protein
MAPEVGLEPTTLRLTAECSAIELLRIAWETHKQSVDCSSTTLSNAQWWVKEALSYFKTQRRPTLPRFSRLNRSDVTADFRAIYDRHLHARGNVPYFFRVVAHRPQNFATMMAPMEAVLSTGTLPTKLE